MCQKCPKMSQSRSSKHLTYFHAFAQITWHRLCWHFSLFHKAWDFNLDFFHEGLVFQSHIMLVSGCRLTVNICKYHVSDISQKVKEKTMEIGWIGFYLPAWWMCYSRVCSTEFRLFSKIFSMRSEALGKTPLTPGTVPHNALFSSEWWRWIY